MNVTLELLKSAVSKLDTDDRFYEVHLELLNAAISYIYDVEHDDEAVYADGRKMSGGRLLKVGPWGRAVIELANKINEEGSK